MRRLRDHIDLLISVVFAALVAACVICFELNERNVPASSWALLASDGCFVAGVLLTGTGLLTAIAQAGGFDGLMYIFYSLGARFNFSSTNWKAKKAYADFKRERSERHKEYRAALYTGIVCLILAAVFAGLSEL